MNTFRILSLSALLAVSAGAQAAATTTHTAPQSGSFSYDYVEASFGELDHDANALYVGGALSMDKNWGLTGNIGSASAPHDVNAITLQGGAFFHTPLNKQADFYGRALVDYVDVNHGGGNDLGIEAAAGIRFAVQDNFDLEGELGVYQVDPGFTDTGLGIKVDARYFLNKQVSAAVGVASQLDFDGLFVNVRYNFK